MELNFKADSAITLEQHLRKLSRQLDSRTVGPSSF